MLHHANHHLDPPALDERPRGNSFWKWNGSHGKYDPRPPHPDYCHYYHHARANHVHSPPHNHSRRSGTYHLGRHRQHPCRHRDGRDYPKAHHHPHPYPYPYPYAYPNPNPYFHHDKKYCRLHHTLQQQHYTW